MIYTVTDTSRKYIIFLKYLKMSRFLFLGNDISGHTFWRYFINILQFHHNQSICKAMMGTDMMYKVGALAIVSDSIPIRIMRRYYGLALIAHLCIFSIKLSIYKNVFVLFTISVNYLLMIVRTWTEKGNWIQISFWIDFDMNIILQYLNGYMVVYFNHRLCG